MISEAMHSEAVADVLALKQVIRGASVFVSAGLTSASGTPCIGKVSPDLCEPRFRIHGVHTYTPFRRTRLFFGSCDRST